MKPWAPYLYPGGRQTDGSGKEASKVSVLMLLPNRSLKTHMYRNVSTVRSLTASHAAHYHVVFASLLKGCTPTGGKEGSWMDASRRRNYGFRARYKPRGLESWPSTRVRQLPSSKQSEGYLRAGPYKAGAQATFSRCTQTYSRLKKRSMVESPRREASSPRIPSNRAEIHMITLWHFWRASPWPPADPYRTGHGLPLKSPANSSPGIVRTRPLRVVWRSTPLLHT
jgi:hypothetical protein